MTKFDDQAIRLSWERTAISERGDELFLMLRILPPARQHSSAPPVDVSFALDRSGSMSGAPIRLVKEAVKTGSAMLSDQDRLALVVYDDQVDVIHPLQPVSPTSRTLLRAALAKVDARGSTDLGGGWMRAALQLADSPPASKGNRPRLQRTLLLTDGLANQGITDAGELSAHAGQLRSRGITTSTLGVGDHFDEMLLVAMAEAGGGNFQYIPSATELPGFFQKELGRLLSTVVSSVVLTIQSSPGVTTELISSYPSMHSPGGCTVTIGELGEDEETIVLVAITTPHARPGTTVPVQVTCTWVDTASGEPDRTTIPSPDLTVVAHGSPLLADQDPTVAEQTALQRAASDQREAMQLDREGRYTESRAAHSRAARHLAAAPDTSTVRERLREAEQYAEFRDDAAIPERIRKQAVHANYRRGRGRADNS